MTSSYGLSYNRLMSKLQKLEPKPLKYTELEGISQKQLQEHHDVLYVGYVNKYNEIVELLEKADNKLANATYSELRELQLEKGFALNGVKLHEWYFENMTDQRQDCAGAIKELIEDKWGSIDTWADQFAAMGLASRGWVVLAWDYEAGTVDNYICDVHNQGGIWSTVPLLVLDVYEHAYFLDYATARKGYIEAFMQLIDWNIVNKRIEQNIPTFNKKQ